MELFVEWVLPFVTVFGMSVGVFALLFWSDVKFFVRRRFKKFRSKILPKTYPPIVLARDAPPRRLDIAGLLEEQHRLREHYIGLANLREARDREVMNAAEAIERVNPIIHHNIEIQFHQQEDKMGNTEEFYNKPLKSFQTWRNEANGEIGIEIECEGRNLPGALLSHWNTHQDNSLRPVGDHPPVEYVLKKPIARDEVNKVLKYLTSKLKESEAAVVDSRRTSVHVHVNVQDYTIRQLYCFILLYVVFEEMLVEWSGPDRVGNLFCLRAKDSDYIVDMLTDALKQRSTGGWREDMRYAACNLNSVRKFGSLEFRSLRGTVDEATIKTWVDLLLVLKDQALGYDSPLDIIDEFNRVGPIPFFVRTFQRKEHQALFVEQPDLSAKLWSGARMIRDVARCTDWKPPRKKSEKKPTDDIAREAWLAQFRGIKRDVTLSLPNGGIKRVRTIYRIAEDGLRSSRVTDDFTGDPRKEYDFVIPFNHTMYYVETDNGNHCKLDLRPGQSEALRQGDLPILQLQTLGYELEE